MRLVFDKDVFSCMLLVTLHYIQLVLRKLTEHCVTEVLLMLFFKFMMKQQIINYFLAIAEQAGSIIVATADALRGI